jgi:hypothetical protein
MIRGVGYYYERPPDEDKPPGCLETLLIVRGALGVVLLPLAVIVLVLLDIAVTVALFTVHPALALLTIVPTGMALWAYARWERRHFRPPGM